MRGRIFSHASLIVKALAILAVPAAAQAIPLYNVQFTNDTAGSPPAVVGATLTPGQTNTMPSGLALNDPLKPGSSAAVQESFTAGTATLANKPLVFTRTAAGNSVLTLDSNISDYGVKQNASFSCDVLIGSNTSNVTVFMINFYRNGSGQPIGGIAFERKSNGTGNILLFGRLADNTFPAVSFNGTWTPTTPKVMHTTSYLDFTAKTLSFYVDNQLVGTVAMTVSPADVGLRKITINDGTGSAMTGTIAIDNLVTSTQLVIPEPAMVSSLLIGGASLLRRRHASR